MDIFSCLILHVEYIADKAFSYAIQIAQTCSLYCENVFMIEWILKEKTKIQTTQLGLLLGHPVGLKIKTYNIFNYKLSEHLSLIHI